MLIGYARVSTEDQDTAMQRDALIDAGCEKLFEETASGAKVDRVELLSALKFARKGDTIVVWKLDRLARSLAQLITTVEALAERGIGIRSLTETIDSTRFQGTIGALGRFTSINSNPALSGVPDQCMDHCPQSDPGASPGASR